MSRSLELRIRPGDRPIARFTVQGKLDTVIMVCDGCQEVKGSLEPGGTRD